MGKQVVRNDRIMVGGTDISHLVASWTLINNVGNIRVIQLEILADDEITINGKTIAQMFSH